MIKTRTRGFTLVELLVVISLIAALVATTAVMAPKMLKKGSQTKSLTGMRQMITALTSYANDHSNHLPPAVTKDTDSEAKVETYWYMYCEQTVSGGELSKYTNDKFWKENKQTVYVNPMQQKRFLTKTSPGYAMNGVLARNVALSRGDDLDVGDSKYTAVSLNAVQEPEHTPVIMPHWSNTYVCDKNESGDKRFLPFQVNERVNVLFLDGHVLQLSPREYVTKGLDRFPKPEKSE